MFEKRLFYAFAALLCLVLAYHVGARNAGAQGADQMLVAKLDEGSRPDQVIYVTQQERVVRFASSTNACSGPHGGPVGPVPGTSPIIMVEQGYDIWVVVVLADGSVYTQHREMVPGRLAGIFYAVLR